MVRVTQREATKSPRKRDHSLVAWFKACGCTHVDFEGLVERGREESREKGRCKPRTNYAQHTPLTELPHDACAPKGTVSHWPNKISMSALYSVEVVDLVRVRVCLLKRRPLQEGKW